MQLLIEYLTEVLNIKSDNEFVIKDIMTELQKVDDIVAYRKYVRDNIKNIDLAYLTGFQKFIQLTNQYIKQQEETKLPHDTAKSFSENLTKKVYQARTFIKNQLDICNERPFSTLAVDGKKFFNDKELRALAELGSPYLIIELSQNDELEDSLIRLFLNKYIAKSKYKQLGENQKKVLKLIGGAS